MARTVKAFNKMPNVVVLMIAYKYKSEFVMWPFQNFTKMLAEQLKSDNEGPLSNQTPWSFRILMKKLKSLFINI